MLKRFITGITTCNFSLCQDPADMAELFCKSTPALFPNWILLLLTSNVCKCLTLQVARIHLVYILNVCILQLGVCVYLWQLIHLIVMYYSSVHTCFRYFLMLINYFLGRTKVQGSSAS